MKADVPREYNLIELRAENFKALKAVRITPDGGIFKISGRNAAGKSSVLDAVSAGLAGRKAFPKEPIRQGAEEAIIELDFGGLQLKRRITRKDGGGFTDTLTLQFADGKRPKEPQHILDTLRGSPIADDPIAFARLKPKDRYDLLKQLVPDFDFDDHAEKRRELFDERTATGREFERAKGFAESIVLPLNCPTTSVDVTELAAKLREAGEHNNKLERRTRRRQELAANIETARDEADRKTAQANALMREVEALNLQAAADEATLKNAEPLPDPISTALIEQQIADADTRNNAARRAGEKSAAIAKRDNLEKTYDDLTSKISESDKAKAEAIAQAKLPVPEITFGEDDILLDGLPFDQASTARKIRVSTALLMALKPSLRVLLVREGSLLDRDARAALEADAKANNFVVLMECVSESIDGDGVMIEDGEIV
jgi:DNA repair exonuclease SbcCD ATPase subunit